MTKRYFTPREKNHLRKFGFKDFNKTDEYGQMPVEYITGKAEFCDRVFEVNKNVLIPRVETEELIDLALEEIKYIKKLQGAFKLQEDQASNHQPIIIADVGTGSGAIGITLALELAKRHISFEIYLSDVSESALQVAQQNFKKFKKQFNALQSKATTNAKFKVHFLASDLFDSYPTDLQFDLILANLPYIPAERLDKLFTSVKDYEPRVALDGGAGGLVLIERFLKQAKSRLKEKAVLLMETDAETIEHIQSSVYNIEIIKDQFERSRFLKLTKDTT